MSVLLLCLVLVLGLIMIPFGLPGTWIIAGAAVGYSVLVPDSIGVFTMVMIAILAIIGEVIEWTLTAKYTKKYGGSRSAQPAAQLTSRKKLFDSSASRVIPLPRGPLPFTAPSPATLPFRVIRI